MVGNEAGEDAFALVRSGLDHELLTRRLKHFKGSFNFRSLPLEFKASLRLLGDQQL
jgi:hypothetical protein